MSAPTEVPSTTLAEDAYGKLQTTTSPRVRLIPGMVVKINDRECVVERRLKDRWWFLCLDNEPLNHTDRELASLMADGQFFVISRPGDQKNIRSPVGPLNVSEEAHRENMRKLDYVTACKQHPNYCRSRPALAPIIAEVEQRRQKSNPGEKRRPCFSTLMSWIDLYEKFGPTFGAAALSERHDLKGRYGERLPEYQRKAIDAGIEHWLKRTTKANAYATVQAEVMRFDRDGLVDKTELEPKFLDENGQLKAPSRREFERRCERVPPMVREAMRKGARYARRISRTYGTNLLPDRPYKDVEIDHATLDLVLRHRKGVILGRPDLVVFRDRATGLILGWGFGYDQPCYASFLLGLESAIYGPKLNHLPGIKNKPEWFGRFENLYLDNALHLIGKSINEAGLQLGFNLVRLQPKAPWLKGAVERWFRELGLGLTHRLPGTTLEHAVAKREYETLGEATLYVDQFEALLARWICDIYNARPSKSLGFIRGFDSGTSPLDAWRAKVNDYEVDQLPPRELFVALAGQIEERTIQNNGITIDHITYEGPALSRITGHPDHRRQGMHGRSTQYRIARDPHDLGHVFLIDPYTGDRLEIHAAAAHAPYANRRTLVEHEIIVRNAINLRNKKRPQIKDLIETQAELNAFGAKIAGGEKYKTVQRKLARYLEGDRLREQRSNVIAFPPPGADYLAPQRSPLASKIIESPRALTEVAAATAVRDSLDEQLSTTHPEVEDDDISLLRDSKNWRVTDE